MEKTKKKKLHAILEIDESGLLEQIEKVWKAKSLFEQELSNLTDSLRTFGIKEIKDSEESSK